MKINAKEKPQRKEDGGKKGKVIFGFKRPITPTPRLLPAHVFDTKARVSRRGDRRRFVVTSDAHGD